MSSKFDFQEFQFPDNRRKVDFQNMEKGSFRCKPVCDLRKSLAWDSAFLNSPGVLDPEELFETLNLQVANDGEDLSMSMDRKQMPLHSESIEPARASGISNMRKSLAWDTAFFTSAGVLDAEELSVVNRGFKKSEKFLLPGVEEDNIWRSAESNSTVTSDGYSLASLELDLFDDIRASIRQKRDASSNEPSLTPKLNREKGRQNGYVSRRPDDSSQPSASGGGSNPSSRKPPKISNRASPLPILPSKRASLSASHVKMDNKFTKSADGKTIGMSKKMCLRNLPSSVLPAAVDEYARFCSASADFTGKSPSNFARRTKDSRPGASTSSTSTLRTPLRYSTRNKTELVNSSASIRFFSTPDKSSISKSPSSSFDGWSSGSSSYTSLKQRYNSYAASPLNSTPLKEIFDRDSFKSSCSERHRCGQSCSEHEISEFKLWNSHNYDIPMCTTPAPTDVSRKLKPSGLKMPSPKIGYFDTESSTGPVSKAKLPANRTKYGRHRSAGGVAGSVGKSGSKKQPLRELSYIKGHVPGEGNKENIISFENQVDDLSKRMGTIGFSRV
ncbi:uncharacterized protein LOC126661265 isoform X2 [Mercurialis annua]|uniref:uncharacterized protein LOC126661265 isoform X2 n=1 Tax=Mercurialis annua TaxID=3986 RepID=UPI0021601870|nr:uncharacterized protein LOC126661265 isoform X2 [Mercurialis annua]